MFNYNDYMSQKERKHNQKHPSTYLNTSFYSVICTRFLLNNTLFNLIKYVKLVSKQETKETNCFKCYVSRLGFTKNKATQYYCLK